VSEPVNINPASWGDAEVGPLNGASGQRLADRLIAEVAEHPNVRTVCDLGCGNGYLAGRLSERGYDVVGVDASEPYIETARRTHSSPRVRFERAVFSAGLATQIAGAPFDLVISSDVIEHLYRPVDLLETAHALLKPSGILIVGTPYHGYLKNLAIVLSGKWDEHHGVHWNGGHIKFFSVPTLRQMVEDRGFEVTRFSYYGRAPWLWKNMICVARKR
jgi:2-polyprenyl-3-methyl-5-hydroxy-6-metoxy-1,4-benzoquinol methylase